MALQNYVLSKYVSGITKDDIELDIIQMSENDSYLIIAPKRLIAYDIFNSLENFLHPKYTENMIRSLLDTDGKYKLSTYDLGTSSVVESIILSVDNESQTYYYDLKGGLICRQIYNVSQMDDGDVGYLVTEHIVNPFKGCDLIERCYTPYFHDLFTARQYRSNRMKNYSVAKGTPNSGYRISVVNIHDIEQSNWYLTNLRVADSIKEYHLNPEDYRYIPDIEIVKNSILADSYDDLDLVEQAKVNRAIFDSLRDFIDSEFLFFLDDDIASADDEDVEEITDNAIILALVNAKTQEDFQKVHDILGPNEYRIGALTDDIYNNHPDAGYIVVSKDGDLGWYASCYAINEWDGSIGNPFHGVFQPNENDVLYCFREFHPEVIADRLPKKIDVQYYDDLYQKELADSRRLHPELEFDYNEDGDEVVFGTWYYEGLLSSKHIDDICFFRDYGSHVFTEEECRILLSGEELVIEHFVTKMDFEITIRGKLKDCSSIFDEESQIVFTRTDINASKRKSLNAEFGFEEPGLPPVDID